MKISELLKAVASWLENPNNEIMMLSEDDNTCFPIVVASCVEAADLLKKAAEDIHDLEPQESSNLTPESIKELADIAASFDMSEDYDLKKQASVIDELLLTIAAPKNALAVRKDLLEARMEALKSKYDLAKSEKIVKTEEEIKKSQDYKPVKLQEYPLSTRTCIEHPGAQLARIADNRWQCEMDGKVYDYQNGYTLLNGDKVPGGDVANQTSGSKYNNSTNFDSRNGRLGFNR